MCKFSDLMKYILAGDLKQVKDILAKQPELLYEHNENGELIKYLVGDWPGYIQFEEACDEQGYTALFAAVKSNKLELVTYLLGKGMDLHATDSSGSTILEYAHEIKCSEEIIKELESRFLKSDGFYTIRLTKHISTKDRPIPHIAATSTSSALSTSNLPTVDKVKQDNPPPERAKTNDKRAPVVAQNLAVVQQEHSQLIKRQHQAASQLETYQTDLSNLANLQDIPLDVLRHREKELQFVIQQAAIALQAEKEREQIFADGNLTDYYYIVLAALQSNWIGSQAVYSRLVPIKQVGVNLVLGIIQDVADQFPGIGLLTKVITTSFSAWNEARLREGINRLGTYFGALLTGGEIIEACARLLTLAKQKEIQKIVTVNAGMAKELWFNLNELLLTNNINTLLRELAYEDCQKIISAIMSGKLKLHPKLQQVETIVRIVVGNTYRYQPPVIETTSSTSSRVDFKRETIPSDLEERLKKMAALQKQQERDLNRIRPLLPFFPSAPETDTTARQLQLAENSAPGFGQTVPLIQAMLSQGSQIFDLRTALAVALEQIGRLQEQLEIRAARP